MCNRLASQFASGGIYTQYSIKKDNSARIFLDSFRVSTVICSVYLPNAISFVMERNSKMTKQAKKLLKLLKNLVEGTVIYTVLLVITYFTWWLTKKLWMPIFTPLLEVIGLLSFVSGTILYILFVLDSTLEAIFGPDWWRRLWRFLR